MSTPVKDDKPPNGTRSSIWLHSMRETLYKLNVGKDEWCYNLVCQVAWERRTAKTVHGNSFFAPLSKFNTVKTPVVLDI